MSLKSIIAAAGVVATLGAAAPAFADWYRPVPPPVVVPPAPPVYVTPSYGYYGRPGVYYRHDRDDWRWRRWHGEHEWREHEWRAHEWREHEWREHHRHGW